ncbi:MAG: translesion error-prone DNA polymerase V autoproteolytic subunit [Methylococcales bacterium]|nr:translesion error-prone DNA polymerase V autoproteolytic subunit [Methylococcales bacterium]
MSDKQKNNHGGSRFGAGRKKGSSVYGETTKAIRVPESMVVEIKAMLNQRKLLFKSFAANIMSISFPSESPNSRLIPLFSGKVAAGFPSPADDYIEKTLDLNDLLIQRPAATFFVRAEGESMLGAGIHPNDILVVDRSIEPIVGKIVICALNGELTVKRLNNIGDEIILGAENPAYSDIVVKKDIELVIWGVVTNVIHAV